MAKPRKSKPATKPEKGKIRSVRSTLLSSTEVAELDGAPLFDPDSLDEAIIATSLTKAGQRVAVYSYNRLVELFEESFAESKRADGEDPVGTEALNYEDGAEFMAMEWVEANVLHAVEHLGGRAPIVIEEITDEEIDENEIDSESLLELKGKKWLIRQRPPRAGGRTARPSVGRPIGRQSPYEDALPLASR